MTDSYSYTRFRWVEVSDLNPLAERLRETGFEVGVHQLPTSENDVSPYRNQRTSLHVKADTLNAIISPSRATLSQRARMPFTARDMRLREIVLEEFPHVSSSFFPWGFNVEPAFELEKSG